MTIINQLFSAKLLAASALLMLQSLSVSAENEEVATPLAFTINCSGCHLLDKAVVGPSLVDIAKIYHKDEAAFIKWCVEPGKKRPQMPQMPSMAHVAEGDLKEIYQYIIKATKGTKNAKVQKGDLYAESPTMAARPRIIRTFIPDSGPASLYVALPTEEKHNLVWDTDLCRLRYITTGEASAWGYYRSNGNDLAKMGKKCYTENASLFTSELKPEFKGYRVKEGLPTFIYMIGEVEITEAIELEGNVIKRTFTGSPSLPVYQAPDRETKELRTTSQVSGQSLTVIHTAQ